MEKTDFKPELYELCIKILEALDVLALIMNSDLQTRKILEKESDVKVKA